MTTPMKYLVWRAGRPRWSPGPDLRARGFKGQDLRHPSGEWMRLGEAILAAQALNEAAGIAAPLPNDIPELEAIAAQQNAEKRREADAQGYVYFLMAEQRVKIGFSTNPLRRTADLRTASAMPVEALMFVPGTIEDEQSIHKVLVSNRIAGEWFWASQRVMNVMTRSLRFRRATADASPL